MHTDFSALTEMSASQLLAETLRFAADEHEATAALVACLAEVDARQLYLSEGYSSMFAYCTQRYICRKAGRITAPRWHGSPDASQ